MIMIFCNYLEKWPEGGCEQLTEADISTGSIAGAGCCPIGVMAGILLRSVVCLRWRLVRASFPRVCEWLGRKLPEYLEAGVLVPVELELEGGLGDRSSSYRAVMELLKAMSLERSKVHQYHDEHRSRKWG